MEAEIVEAPTGTVLPAVAGTGIVGVGVEAKDIQVPTLFLLQKASTLCDEDPDLKVGMILDSVDHRQFGSVDQGLMFIPLSYKKDWVIMSKGKSKFEWHSFQEYNADTANLAWTWEEDGIEFRRDERISFFCLLPEQIDKEVGSDDDDFDPDDVVLPVRICFKRSSYKAGKTILTFFAKIEEARRRGKDVPYYHSIFNIKSVQEKNNDGDIYQVAKIEKIAKTPDNQKGVCENWSKQMEESTVVIDESLEVEVEESPKEKQARPVAKGEEKF